MMVMVFEIKGCGFLLEQLPSQQKDYCEFMLDSANVYVTYAAALLKCWFWGLECDGGLACKDVLQLLECHLPIKFHRSFVGVGLDAADVVRIRLVERPVNEYS
jgi:hypothetical protein